MSNRSITSEVKILTDSEYSLETYVNQNERIDIDPMRDSIIKKEIDFKSDSKKWITFKVK